MEIVNSNNQLIYDQKKVLKRLDNDAELVKVLLSAYVNDLPGSVEEIKEAVAHNDYNKVQTVAHKIKGSSATVGVISLEQIAMSIELVCKENRFEQINDLMVEFLKKYEIVMDFFSNYRN